MKTPAIVFSTLFFAVNAFGMIESNLHCISSDGLDLEIPSGFHFYMQPLILKNDFQPGFLKNLINRHNVSKNTDKELRLNIGFNNCTESSLNFVCKDDRSFGDATYGYVQQSDAVTVQTPVGGKVDVALSQDANGIFQMQLTIVNSNVKDGVLKITKTFGPLVDLSKQSLTPWSPGCTVTASTQN
jgi:hypothetical protein